VVFVSGRVRRTRRYPVTFEAAVWQTRILFDITRSVQFRNTHNHSGPQAFRNVLEACRSTAAACITLQAVLSQTKANRSGPIALHKLHNPAPSSLQLIPASPNLATQCPHASARLPSTPPPHTTHPNAPVPPSSRSRKHNHTTARTGTRGSARDHPAPATATGGPRPGIGGVMEGEVQIGGKDEEVVV